MSAARIDHFMYAVASLDEGMAWAADTFGVAPAYGGEHVGLGTRNALLSLGSVAAYAACVLPLGVWLTFTAVVAPAIATESLGPVAAIGRSFSLVARRFWLSLGVVLLSSLVAYVVSMVLQALPQALATSLPWAAQWAALTLVNGIVATLTVGPLVISSILLYLDLRVRTEGLDLRQRTTVAFARAR